MRNPKPRRVNDLPAAPNTTALTISKDFTGEINDKSSRTAAGVPIRPQDMM
jgi:hypothetical protein